MATKEGKEKIAKLHLPGLFEFYEFYQVFLPLYKQHREYFYEDVSIASIYGAPEDCIWSGGRFGANNYSAEEVLDLLAEYGISARLTFSNSLLREEHLTDEKCNALCSLFEKYGQNNGDTNCEVQNGVIVHSDLLLEHIRKNYPGLYLVSSTTKVLTNFDDFKEELLRPEFQYVVPDFRLNKSMEQLLALPENLKDKVEFLCNECCYTGCKDRKICYENVSRRVLGEDCQEHICTAPGGNEGYLFSKAMKNPTYIGINEIRNTYLPGGFTNFKIEGRGLGTALILEMLIHYMVKPEYALPVREQTYLDSMLDLF